MKKLKLYIAWAKTHKKQTVKIGGIVLAVILILAISISFLKNSDNVNRTAPDGTGEEQAELTTLPSPLTGLLVDQAASTRPVTGIVIENSPDARPQSSLHKAGVVFEAIAEGGITRYLAFYQEERPDIIGPVRSLRPYFIDWMLTFDAVAVHVGGSAEALDEVNALGVKDLDQFFNDQYYWRSTDRYAPHNVYTKFDFIDQGNESKGFTTSEFTSITRKEPAPIEIPTASSISVDISIGLYNSSYLYDKATNSYQRSLAGAPEIDRESNKQITPKVVVVMVAPYSVSADGRYHYDLVGSGPVKIFQDGSVIDGIWTKSERSSQITFADATGTEIGLNPGQTWITAVDDPSTVSYTP